MEDPEIDVFFGLLGKARTLAATEWWPMAIDISFARRFNFNDFSSQTTQQQGAIGTGEEPRQVEHHQPL
jgi:hypothetical protein